MNRKTHFTVNGHNACGRGQAETRERSTQQVTCFLCQSRPEFIAAKAADDDARQAAFEAQVPRQIGEPWRDGTIVCRECDGDLFRQGDRNCYGHYDNFHCVNCGHVESRFTETGMSF